MANTKLEYVLLPPLFRGSPDICGDGQGERASEGYVGRAEPRSRIRSNHTGGRF